MNITPVLEALQKAGATSEMLIAAVDAFEKQARIELEEKRQHEANRKRQYRMSQMSHDVPGTNGTLPLNGSNGFPDPSLTSLNPIKENTPKGVQKKVSQIELPDWLPLAEWGGFKEMRIKIKKPMTGRAEKLALGKLDRYRQLGHDPTEILNQSILNDYQDLYEPKGQTNEKSSRNITPGESKWVTEGKRLAAKYREQALAGGQSETS